MKEKGEARERWIKRRKGREERDKEEEGEGTRER